MLQRALRRLGLAQEAAGIREFRITASDGKTYVTTRYNLDAAVSVGYRVKSHRGTQFRIWATRRLKQYIVKGFTPDDDMLKKGGGDHFDELLERIREIRASERNFYQKVKDIYPGTHGMAPSRYHVASIFLPTIFCPVSSPAAHTLIIGVDSCPLVGNICVTTGR